MGHRHGRRRRRRSRRPPLTETYRPIASRVRANVRTRIPTREHTTAGEDRPVRNPLGVRDAWCDGGGSSWRKEQMGREIARASARSDRMRLSSDGGERGRER